MLIIGLFLVFYLLDLKAVQPSTMVIEFRGCTVEDKCMAPNTQRPLAPACNEAPNWRAEV